MNDPHEPYDTNLFGRTPSPPSKTAILAAISVVVILLVGIGGGLFVYGWASEPVQVAWNGVMVGGKALRSTNMGIGAGLLFTAAAICVATFILTRQPKQR